MNTPAVPDENAFRRLGLIYGSSAYLLWGLLPLLFAAAAPTGALELVANRVIWALVFCAILLVFARGFARTWQIVKSGSTFWLLAVAAVLIAINWTTFIYGIDTGHLVEISLGYYLNPLISIGLGVVFLKERLRPLQWAAVGFGLVAVIIVGLGLGRVPYLAFSVALSFGFYGLVKNKVGAKVGALEGMTIETAILALPSLAYLGVLAANGTQTFTGYGALHVVIVLDGSGHRDPAHPLRGRGEADSAVVDRDAPVHRADPAVHHRHHHPRRGDVDDPLDRLLRHLDRGHPAVHGHGPAQPQAPDDRLISGCGRPRSRRTRTGSP